jgi:hypothetical protein
MLRAGLSYPALFLLTVLLTAGGLLAALRLPAKAGVSRETSADRPPAGKLL